MLLVWAYSKRASNKWLYLTFRIHTRCAFSFGTCIFCCPEVLMLFECRFQPRLHLVMFILIRCPTSLFNTDKQNIPTQVFGKTITRFGTHVNSSSADQTCGKRITVRQDEFHIAARVHLTGAAPYNPAWGHFAFTLAAPEYIRAPMLESSCMRLL